MDVRALVAQEVVDQDANVALQVIRALAAILCTAGGGLGVAIRSSSGLKRTGLVHVSMRYKRQAL